MQPEDVLKTPAKVLNQAQREFYFDNGYLLIESIVPRAIIDRLNAVTEEMVERSRKITKSDAIFDLEPGHTAAKPRLRRLTSPVEHHPAYWEFASQSVIADVAADLVGPNVKFHHSTLNFKWAEGGEEVKWHQDIQYWPHTNYSPLTIGVYLHDVGPEQGPLAVVPGSHKGELFDQYNSKNQWVGCIAEQDLQRVALDQAHYLLGPAGSITIHNCRAVHGSKPNLSDLGRPLLLNVFSAADAFPYTANPLPSRHAGAIVRGKPARWARHDERPCQIPPDWSYGYTSLFALQQEESWDTDQLRTVAEQHAAMRGETSGAARM
ncbi:MAG: phytanoyl-CoA dioxygenase family protein [Gammaproteobacteria bacterium]